MKAESISQQKTTIVKKPIKPLNQKKSSISIQNTLQKQKSKTILTLNDLSQIPQIKIQKLGSPKNLGNQYSMVSPKTQANEQFFKSQKSDLKKISNLQKTKKPVFSKHEPIKKQSFVGIKSPKNIKNATIQSQIYLNSEKSKSNFNQESNLNIDLDTSIANVQMDQDNIKETNFDSNYFNTQDSTNYIFLNSQQIRIQQLTKTSTEQCFEIQRLKQQNQELQKKVNKMKIIQQQNRKKLRQRISTFNGQGEQTMALKQKIISLQKRIQELQNQHQIFRKPKVQNLVQQKIVTKFGQIPQNTNYLALLNGQILNVLSLKIDPVWISEKVINKCKMIDESIMTSFEDSICDGVLSCINVNFSNCESSSLSNDKKQEFIESCNLIQSLQIEMIKNSFQEKYQQKILQIQNLYRQNLLDVQNRYKYLVQQTGEVVKSQESQIVNLQNKLDDLYQKLQECTCIRNNHQTGPNIETDQQKLKLMMKINESRQKITKKEEQLKQCRQEIRSKQIQCKKSRSQLDIERIKFNLHSELTILKKDLVQIVQNQQLELMKQELRQQKEKSLKLQVSTQKKEELIKKLTSYQNGNLQNNKKMRK